MFFWSCLGLLSLPSSAIALQAPLHHDLTVTLDPLKKSSQIRDVLTLRLHEKKDPLLRLYLHADYWIGKIAIPENEDLKIETRRASNGGEDISLTEIAIRKPQDQPWPDPLKIELEYEGKIFDPQNSQDPGSPDEGILLSGASYFYPQTLTQGSPDLMTFELTVLHPPDWKVVSQGRRKPAAVKNGASVTWESPHPMEEIFLIANRFEVYQDQHRGTLLYAYLLNKDPGLAGRYIGVTGKYLDFYEKLIGPYPYPKFALVENSRQTGYGMASFTFLGSRVIRFPFILHTSYPHEILHNWWGNSVYIDPASGNWAEGLTSYLSDHLLADLENKGSQYRLQQLMNFMNYVNTANDFPLIDFKFRTTMASQAIGYGKMLMMIHMLRLEVGDDLFLQALRQFYRNCQFRFAGLDDLRKSFEQVSQKDLTGFFDHWTRRTGAPELELSSASYTPAGNQFELTIEVTQKQSGPAFPFKLPVLVWTKNSSQPGIHMLDMTAKTLAFKISLPEEPGKVMIDPYTEVFRKLSPGEIPSSIAQTYGSSTPTKILPVREDFPDVLLGYHQLAQSVEEDNSLQGFSTDDANLSLPAKGSLWVFGRYNDYAKRLMPQLKNYGVTATDAEVTIAGIPYPWEDHSFVFTLPRPENPESSVTWVIVNSGESIPGLIRKLPHYGKYGYLVFEGKEPENKLKGTWPFESSLLTKTFQPDKIYSLPPQPPLVNYKPN